MGKSKRTKGGFFSQHRDFAAKWGFVDYCGAPLPMLMLRAKPPESWLPKVITNLEAVLIDHAHLERKAAKSALSLQRYQRLGAHLLELTAIAIEELEHFKTVLNLLDDRKIPFRKAISSPWISGIMNTIRKGRKEQVIDHLLCAAMIEGRSCEKFHILAEALFPVDAPLAKFYDSLVESEGNHYAAYLLMAKEIDEAETNRRLDFYLDLDAELVKRPSDLHILH
ncbi:MAG: tRNA isopentenyl-2-thiomethyl-A-37 hydroxylase MiaE [Verrucomicrobiota bacterium]|nr:tRNA isopentenyl-2-thiomethyl-A-37 hydroxylase MiaE [Verrucomicrobiota bacterium]